MERMAREEFKGARQRVFGTDSDNGELGRVFVWTQIIWFERVEAPETSSQEPFDEQDST
jgi:hypothetical protein